MRYSLRVEICSSISVFGSLAVHRSYSFLRFRVTFVAVFSKPVYRTSLWKLYMTISER